MDKIQEKTSKFFNDINKRKSKVGKSIKIEQTNPKEHKDQKPSESSYNSCVYCYKVFVNSKYLMKHVIRRHSDELVLLHKNSAEQGNNNSCDLQHLISFLQNEFSTLKKELLAEKSLDADEKENGENCKESQNSELGENALKAFNKKKTTRNSDFSDIKTDEVKLFKETLCGVEKNIQCLHNKFEDLDKALKNEVLLKPDANEYLGFNEEKILQAQKAQFIDLKQILLNDLKAELFTNFLKNNSQWKAQLTELRHEIKRLDRVVNAIKEQVECPDYLKQVEKRLEHHITHFLGNSKHRRHKTETSRCKRALSIAETRIQSEERRKSKCRKFDKISESSKQAATSFNTQSESLYSVSEKLIELNIAPDACKISCADYDKKMMLINTEKDKLARQYPNFYEIYENINMQADYKANSKLKKKQHRKIRFSDPLSSSESILSVEVQNANNIDRASPSLLHENKLSPTHKTSITSDTEKLLALKKKTYLIPESQEFILPDFGAGGDCLNHYSKSQNNVVQYMEEHSKEFETSSPISDINKSKKIDPLEDSVTVSSVLSGHETSAYLSSDSPKNSNHFVTVYPTEHKGSKQFLNMHKVNEVCSTRDLSEDCDFEDEQSLESLSSFDDENDQ